MTMTKRIAVTFLIMMLVCSGLPPYSPEDRSRDSRIDLRDVILQVRDLTQSAEDPDRFSTSVRGAISTLDIVSGGKTGLVRSDGTEAESNSHISDFTYLIASCDFLQFPILYSGVSERPSPFKSHSVSPDSPPPRA